MCIMWLFSEILIVETTVKDYERKTARDTNQPGVVMVELVNVFEKKSILRVKRQCEEYEETKDIVIKGCDSHDACVSKINTRFLLKHIQNRQDYYVTAPGLIRKKDDNAVLEEGDGEPAELGANGNIGGTAPSEGSTHAGMSDNTGGGQSQQNNEHARPKTSNGIDRGGGGKSRGRGGTAQTITSATNDQPIRNDPNNTACCGGRGGTSK